ncbi:MAG: Uma2 family endonuclease [Syntrophobacteraceae bacterium]|nr:Uma2 family endonuclease [Syntrophobacteraceae bacterium]
MAEAAGTMATYADLYGIPENMTGEIIAGELVVTPRPSGMHANAAFTLSAEIGPPFRFGRGGPGGWIILIEPEVRFSERDLLVPDLAGWRKERFPGWPEENWFSTPPGWICEILSPGTASRDRIHKMRIYAEHGVEWLWLVDPRERILEVYALESGRCVRTAAFAENDRVRAEPFEAIEIELDHLWIDAGTELTATQEGEAGGAPDR